MQGDPWARYVERLVRVMNIERRREGVDPSLNDALVFLNFCMSLHVLGRTKSHEDLTDQAGLHFHMRQGRILISLQAKTGETGIAVATIDNHGPAQ
jgi:hypothetical protein